MKYNKDICITLLRKKQEELKQAGAERYPARSDFAQDEVVAIKAFLGPWPRALEAAELKPPRSDGHAERCRERRIRAKRARNAARRASDTGKENNIEGKNAKSNDEDADQA